MKRKKIALHQKKHVIKHPQQMVEIHVMKKTNVYWANVLHYQSHRDHRVHHVNANVNIQHVMLQMVCVIV